ncbi:MAG: hypothetical protein MUO76_19125 [Anaerolineaceae bacterium]|nr:hypothetical protein [Anaerolineaceae bacterium]
MTGNNAKSESNFKDSLVTISAVLGFLTALVSFILNVQKWVQEPQTLRAVSVAGFILYLLGSLWFAFKVRNVNQKWRFVCMTALYIFSAFYFIWVGTWMVTSAPSPVVIDTMDGVSLWSTYLDDKGSSAVVSSVPSQTTNALEISYTVEEFGFAAVSREINPEILNDTKAIRFSYKGSGDPNTIELKVVYKPEANGKSPVFGVLWNQATDVQEWTSLEAPYNLFICWTDTGCQAGEGLDPRKVWKMDIAISNKTGDTIGSGVVQIDDIQGVR